MVKKGNQKAKASRKTIIIPHPKNRKRNKFERFAIYIHRVFREKANAKNDNIRISKKSVRGLNAFCNDIFQRIVTEGANMLRKDGKKTLTEREIQAAIRITMPDNLAKEMITRGNSAISKYNKS